MFRSNSAGQTTNPNVCAIGGRSRSPAALPSLSSGHLRIGACRQGRDYDNSDRLPYRRRPVALGLVASLNRTGGNVTGVNAMSVETGTKRLGLLEELLPRAARFAVLFNPNDPNAEHVSKDLRTAKAAIGRWRRERASIPDGAEPHFQKAANRDNLPMSCP